MDLTVDQIESLVEARQRFIASQSHTFIEDLQVGIACLTQEGQKSAVRIAELLAARARGEFPERADYTDETNEVAL